MSEITSQVRALDASDDAISERIITRSRQMQAFHRSLRERLQPVKKAISAEE